MKLSEEAYAASQASAKIFAHQFADKHMQNVGGTLKKNLPYGMRAKWDDDLLEDVRIWESTLQAGSNPDKTTLQDYLYQNWLSSNKSPFFEAVSRQSEIFDVALQSHLGHKTKEALLSDLILEYSEENITSSHMYSFPFVVSLSVMIAGMACATRDKSNVLINEIQKLVSTNGIVEVVDDDESSLTRHLEPFDRSVRGKITIKNNVSE